MLKQASISEVNQGQLSKADGYLVIVTRYYPRFLPNGMVDEYTSDLAPAKALFNEFKLSGKKLRDHDLAFEKVKYQEKFTLTAKGLEALKRLAELSKATDVYLLCYCQRDQCCHRELLLMMAENFFKAKVDKLSRPYEVFQQRLDAGTVLPPTNEKSR